MLKRRTNRLKKAIVTMTTTAILSTAFIAHASASTHKVQAGESLWSISKKYNTNVNELKTLNNLSKDAIYPNQVLKVVHTSSLPQENIGKSVQPKPEIVQSHAYTVKSGDTLGKIAMQYSIPLSELMRRNNLSSHMIFPGQKLMVWSSSSIPDKTKPTLPAYNPTNTYTVKAGDTLSHISSKVGISIQQIKDLNGLTKDTIYIGQQLKTVKATGTQTDSHTVPENTTESKKYTVQPGDSLSAIGSRFNVSIQDLKTWNNLTNDRILAGQVLSIGRSIDPYTPGTSPQGSADVLTQARMLLGTPYVWGGTTPAGFDCSGFIYYVHKQAGHELKRYSSEGYYSRSYYVDSPKPGDLVFFENTYKKGISHLGIYLGDNQFIHSGDNGVEMTSLSDSYWSSKFDGYKRLYK
jgi:LysM repeat protein